MSTARDTHPNLAALVQHATESAQLVVRGETIEASVVESGPSAIALIVPKGTRLSVGDSVALRASLSGSASASLDELTIDAMCDTRQFRRSTDPQPVDGSVEGREGALWVRCRPATARASAVLWALSDARDRQESEAPSDGAVHTSKLPGRGHDDEDARLSRLSFLRERTGRSLDSVGHTRLVARQLRNNIENLIGSVEVPVGAAGPLWFNGDAAKGEIFLPMATTEGALVASTTRGATALTLAGGVRTRVLSQTMTRCPGFVFGNIEQGCRFVRWIEDHEDEIRERARSVSRHARLRQVKPVIIGRVVHVRFEYETGDAAGQNMTTACTWAACQWILEHIKHIPSLRLENFFVEAGLSGDKKVNASNAIQGRGARVVAECHLSREVLARVLKVTPEQFLYNHQIGVLAALQMGQIGFNVNVANVIAAAFTACGQDIASVHESSLGILHIEPSEDGVYASMLLPCVVVGTVGGGTQLPQQRDYLEMMGCTGPGSVKRLAEIIAGYCLALDLSTMSALLSGHFALAHERLGRNRPVPWLKKSDFTPELFQKSLAADVLAGDAVVAVHETQVKLGSSVITELSASRNTNKLLGFEPRRLTLQSSAGETRNVDLIMKIKPLDTEATTVMRTVAAACGEEVLRRIRSADDILGFTGCHKRELGVYRQTDPRFVRHVPRLYGMIEDDSREAYVLMLERLEGLTLMDTVDDVSAFESEHLDAVLDGLADLHAIWLGRENDLRAQSWLGPVPSARAMTAAQDLWIALADHARREFPEWVDAESHARWRSIIDDLGSSWTELEAMPRTLIHNDFNPRNFALRPEGERYRLCAYDWELATLHVPQRDLAEMLAFTLTGDFTQEDVRLRVEQYRILLAHKSGVRLDRESFERGFVLSLYDFLINRVAIYAMGHTCRDYRFLPRVFRSLMRMIDLLTTPRHSAKRHAILPPSLEV
jgi:NADP-dependent 3-hydroxy-3-methylglutaryl-CoA reductase